MGIDICRLPFLRHVGSGSCMIQVYSVLFVAAAVWRGGHERDGNSHGPEKEINGIPEKSETKHGRYSV